MTADKGPTETLILMGDWCSNLTDIKNQRNFGIGRMLFNRIHRFTGKKEKILSSSYGKLFLLTGCLLMGDTLALTGISVFKSSPLPLPITPFVLTLKKFHRFDLI